MKASKAAAKAPKGSQLHTYKKSTAKVLDVSMCDVLQSAKKKASSSRDIRDQLLVHLTKATEHGVEFREDIIIGFNAVCRAVNRDEVAVLCMAKKANDTALQFLMEACLVKTVPLAIIPAFSSQLKDALKVKNAFCFAIRRSRVGQRLTAQGDADHRLDAMDVAIDLLRDYVIGLAC